MVRYEEYLKEVERERERERDNKKNDSMVRKWIIKINFVGRKDDEEMV